MQAFSLTTNYLLSTPLLPASEYVNETVMDATHKEPLSEAQVAQVVQVGQPAQVAQPAQPVQPVPR